MDDLATGTKQTSFSSDKRAKHLNTKAKARHWVYVGEGAGEEEEVVKDAAPFFRDFHEFADFSRGIF